MERPYSPSVPHLLQDIIGDRVVLRHLGLQRPQAFGDEAADGVDQLIAGFGIERHCVFVSSRPIRPDDISDTGTYGMDGGDAQAPWTPQEITEGEWAGWRIWSSDPFELLSGPF